MTDERTTMMRDPVSAHAAALAAVAERTGGRLTIEPVPFLAQVSLRLAPSLADRAPYPLPLEPNTAWEDGRRAALWLGPDEWLVLGPTHAARSIVDELEAALADLHRSVIDVSANRVAIELGGPDRFDVLAGGCSLDLDRRSWTSGRCAQTLFAKAQVILHERRATTGILVRPSFADYLIERLLVEA